MILALWILLTVIASIILVILAFIASACIINSRLSRLEEEEWTEYKK